ncbi:MAG: S8 family serine peptidase, partial [Bacteroidetes bacterium]|nr:S8 family serine peptidase [Bacteroidota bacterium]
MYLRLLYYQKGYNFNVGNTNVLRNYWTLLLFIGMAHLTLRGQELRKFQFPPGITVNDCQTQVIIFKLKPDIDLAEDLESDNDLLEIHQVDQVIEMTDCQPLFPNAQYQPHQTRLANIYKVQLPPGTDLLKSINKLLQYSNVEYAEPLYKISLLYVPDDPEADPDTGSQVHLSIVRAYDAWDIQKGDTSQIIAILDTGVKLDHEDLTDNLAYNYDDPINGLDDDNDGFIDNFMGWDIADDDNDPTADFDGHGSEVTGVSSASTDNGLGVAGVGFNAKFLPIKIFRSSDNGFMNGYEAITMAAEQGASVINLSWGGPDAYQQFAQDIIDFAVLDMDVVVVAAAGNTDAELTFYPASYNNVLSVGATENDDTKAGFATYSRHIDLMAPGTTNYTTKNDGSYGNANGSSFSAPLVAGAAALVRAQFPDLTALQVMEQIRVTADDIYQIPFNLPYDEKLGKGRLNMHEALTNNSVPSIRITDLSYQNSFGEFIFYDDTVTITTELINFLNPTQSLKVTLSSSSSSITLIDSIYQPGVVNTLESIENQGSEFKVRVENDLLPGDTLEFRLGFEDDEYQDFQYFNLITSPDYLTVENGDFEMTAGKNGYLGYNMNGFQQGIGLEFEGNKLVDHLGLILTVHPDSVSNNVVNDFMAMERDESFITTKNIRYFNNSTASEDLRSQFNDSNEGDFSMGLIVEEKLLGFQGPNNKSFLIIEYRVINNGSKDLQDLYVGFYSDWNLEDQLSNRADWDGNLNLGYVFDGTSTNYAGIALLTPQSPAYYAIDNLTLNGNTQDIGNDFTKTDKYNFISGGVAKSQAGQMGSGNDVSHLVGGAIDELLLNQSTKIAFVLVAGHTLNDLQAAVSQA